MDDAIISGANPIPWEHGGRGRQRAQVVPLLLIEERGTSQLDIQVVGEPADQYLAVAGLADGADIIVDADGRPLRRHGGGLVRQRYRDA